MHSPGSIETGEIPRQPSLDIPHGVALDDVFWVDPKSIGSVGDLINHAHLSTMALGVVTRAEEYGAGRQDLKQILIEPALDSESGDSYRAKLERAIDVGFMYGVVLASDKREAPEAHEAALPSQLREQFIQAVNDQENDDISAYQMFLRLRDTEVALTGSDILAYSLAITQDHIREVFAETEEGEEPLEASQLTWLQTMYYAGVLAGAYSRTDTAQLPKQPVEVLRRLPQELEGIYIRLEFEPGDDIEAAVLSALASKHTFLPVTQAGKPAIAVVPGVAQFGPNALSYPVFIPEVNDDIACILPDNELDALLIEKSVAYEDGSRGKRVELVTNTAGHILSEHEETEIVGIVSKGRVLSSYHPAHPATESIMTFLEQHLGPVEYYDSITHRQKAAGWLQRNKAELAIATGTAFFWVPDIARRILDANHGIEWRAGSVVTALAATALGGIIVGKKRLNESRENERRITGLIQTYFDGKTLQK